MNSTNTTAGDREITTYVGDLLVGHGYTPAEDGDPGLAGMEPGDTAWYAPNGTVVRLRWTRFSALIDRYDVDGDVVHHPLSRADARADVIVAIARGRVQHLTRCEEETASGICDAWLDEHGTCARADRHI